MSAAPSARSAQKGLALVSVLWGVAILSLIAAAMLTASRNAAHIDRDLWNSAKVRSEADAAISLSILALLDVRTAKQPRADGVPAQIVFDGVAIDTAIQDQAGLVNLNAAPKNLIAAVFVGAGAERSLAGELADRIAARRDGFKSGEIAFRTRDALLEIPGMPRELYGRAAPQFTVYGANPAPDTAVAPRAVLQLLPDVDSDALNRLLKARDDAFAAALRPDAPASSAPRGAAGHVLSISAEIYSGRLHAERTASVLFTGDPARPYLVLAWR